MDRVPFCETTIRKSAGKEVTKMCRRIGQIPILDSPNLADRTSPASFERGFVSLSIHWYELFSRTLSCLSKLGLQGESEVQRTESFCQMFGYNDRQFFVCCKTLESRDIPMEVLGKGDLA